MHVDKRPSCCEEAERARQEIASPFSMDSNDRLPADAFRRLVISGKIHRRFAVSSHQIQIVMPEYIPLR
jgi:hypothetical protein